MTRESSVPPPPPPLTLGHIHDAIDVVCDQMNQKITGKYEEVQKSSNIVKSFDSINNNDIRSSNYQSNYRFRRVTELDYENIIINKMSSARNEVRHDAHNNYDHVSTNNTKAGLLSEQKTSSSTLSKTIDMSRLHGIVAELASSNHNSTNDDINQQTYVITFYIAYSTWDGRVLHIDRFDIDDPNFYINDDKDIDADDNHRRVLFCESDLGVLLRRMLAKIAMILDCSRVVWQHDGIEPIYPCTIQPSTLHDMLTVHWYHDAMIQYILKQQQSGTDNTSMITIPSFHENSIKTTMSHIEIKKIINQCLHDTQQKKSSSSYLPPNGVTIRLATINDVDMIGQLVQDLAIYVKEEDSINITTEYYKYDGFMTYPPLFYCFLLDYHDSSIDDPNDNTTTTFGMAFCYLGYTYKDGLYLYLEDLYIKESFRNNGCGKFVMYQLAYIALSLQCHHIVWGVLDWNKPSIQFYQNIGASILPFNTYKTSRLVKHELETFSSLLY